MIFLEVLLPILCVILIGMALYKQKALPTRQLSKLCIYLFVPSFLFVNVYQSQISWLDLIYILAILLMIQCLVGAPYFISLKKLNTPRPAIGSLVLGAVIFNAGNIGIPVTEMFFQNYHPDYLDEAMTIQILAVMASNLTIWFFGYGLISISLGHPPRSALGFFRLPMIYALLAALIARECRQLGYPVPDAILLMLSEVAKPTVPVMLLVLGGYLVTTASTLPPPPEVTPEATQEVAPPPEAITELTPEVATEIPLEAIPEKSPMKYSPGISLAIAVSLKLALLPLVTYVVCRYLFPGLWPWPGIQLIIVTSCPTAINTFLLSMELKGDSKTAASCVFWSTVFSCATLFIILSLLQYQL